jgi:hypothetical protein
MKKLIALTFMLSVFYLAKANNPTSLFYDNIKTNENNNPKTILNYAFPKKINEEKILNIREKFSGIEEIINYGINIYDFYKKIKETNLYKKDNFRLYNIIAYDKIGLFVEVKF